MWMIRFNTYLQLNGKIFKQKLGIPMGGNASLFIVDLYLARCEYCYINKLVEFYYILAKMVSYNCRYSEDICTVNLEYFGTAQKLSVIIH